MSQYEIPLHLKKIKVGQRSSLMSWQYSEVAANQFQKTEKLNRISTTPSRDYDTGPHLVTKNKFKCC